MRGDCSESQPPFITATAIRKSKRNFQEHILEADTPPIQASAIIRNKCCPIKQPRKRLPLKMIISDVASRNGTSVKTDSEHYIEHSSTCDTIFHSVGLHTMDGKQRYFPEELYGNHEDAPVKFSQNTNSSQMTALRNKNNFPVCPEYHKLFKNNPYNNDSSLFVNKTFTPACDSTPYAKLRFNSLYGNGIHNLNTSSDYSLSQLKDDEKMCNYKGKAISSTEASTSDTHQQEYDTTYLFDAPSPTSIVTEQTIISPVYEKYDCKNSPYPLLLSQDNTDFVGSPEYSTYIEDPNLPPSLPTFSRMNTYASCSINHKCENVVSDSDCTYCSQDCFLNPLVSVKTGNIKCQEIEKDHIDLDINCEPYFNFGIKDFHHISSNNKQSNSYIGCSINMSPISEEEVSNVLCDEPDSVNDQSSHVSLHQYTKRTVTISTKSSEIADVSNQKMNLQPRFSSPEGSIHDYHSLEELVLTDEE